MFNRRAVGEKKMNDYIDKHGSNLGSFDGGSPPFMSLNSIDGKLNNKKILLPWWIFPALLAFGIPLAIGFAAIILFNAILSGAL